MNGATAAELRNMNDEDVMEQLQVGVMQAFDIIVHRYKDRLHYFLHRYTHNHEDSEDLVQETFLRVYRSRNSYQRIAKLSTWIYTIALNLARSMYKKKQRMSFISIHADESDPDDRKMEITDTNILQDDKLHFKNCMIELEKALSELNDDFKEVIILRDVQQLTYEEISVITGAVMGTVKSRIYRARNQLCDLIGDFVELPMN
ncbi:sigma-70 family RNA polymerase sigma factor [Rhodohalobacter sp. SW132]|uniref:RNA polymerase sigma factor n=1 Tax=Rhodohalobacter sp. SW132 TaxID=2293433 RepID=UPI000E259967|nr:sigma-70 family RNA polymerase sigma factor [Rhodohalobacter sp. SW132]REL37994.1 sigma-70 family RNA polymerase sigma factor [Rhodohalobacter sp. SW132]